MKKTMICSCLLTAVLAVSGCGKSVTSDQAKEIVLKDAGVSREEADFTKEKQDGGDYEFIFRTEEAVYEYEVKKNGTIESKEKEVYPQTPAVPETPPAGETPAASETPAAETPAAVPENTPEPETSQTPAADPQVTPEAAAAGDIGEEKAKELALERAGLSEDQVRFKRVEKDMELGILVYEVDFYEGMTEHSCDVNAATGEIVKYKTEVDHE